MVARNRSRAQIRITRERSRPSILMLGILVTIAYAGINWIETVEVATIHARAFGMESHAARVFVVDDPPFVWVRAERPDRLWLRAIKENPEVRLVRGGRDVEYYAIVSNREGTQDNVAALFHEKYGVLDTLSGWLSNRDAVPVRLEPEFF